MAEVKPWEMSYEEPKPWEGDFTEPEEDFHVAKTDQPLERPSIVSAIGTAAKAAGSQLVAGLADVGDILVSEHQQELAKRGITDPVIGAPVPHPYGENLEAWRESHGMGKLPAEDLRSLPKPLQAVGRGAQGLVESVPKLAAVEAAGAMGVPPPVAAAAVFGATPEGFDVKQGAIAAALPFVGKYSGAMVEALASKLGVTKDIALNLFNKIGGAAGAAAYLKTIDESEIAKLPPEQRDQARIDSWANVASQAALGMMGERKTKATEVAQPKETDASNIQKTTEVHGNVLPRSGEGAGQVPFEESGARVQPQTERGIQEKEVGSHPTADQLIAMTPAEIVEWKKSNRYGTNLNPESGTTAIEIAEKLKPEDIPKLEAERRRLESEFLTAYGELPAMPKEQAMQRLQEMLPTQLKSQTIAEILSDYHKSAANVDHVEYQRLAKDFQSAPIDQKFEIQKNIEALKNKYGGKVPPRDLPTPKGELKPESTQQAERVASKIPTTSGKGLAYQVRAGNPRAAEAGGISLGVLHDIVDPVKDKLDDVSRQLSGVAAPITSKLSEDSGNALVRYAAAQQHAPYLARDLTQHVLGDHRNDVPFRERLGAVLVEDRLRAIKQGLTDALKRSTDPKEQKTLNDQISKVNTLVGKDKPFASESDFQQALSDPEIKAAIQRHKNTVQSAAELFHTTTGGQMAGPGVHTGAFVNLEALHEDVPGMVFGSGAKGDYTRPFKRSSKFVKQATGSAEKYQLDYDRLAERMIRGNYDEFSKRQMYDQLQKDGLAQVLPGNEPRPEIGDKPTVKFQIQRRVVPNGPLMTENLWVDSRVAPEVRQALNMDGPIAQMGLVKVANVLNKAQLAGPVDAVWHTGNIFSAITGQQGGKNLLIDLARKIPGVNIIDTSVRLALKAREVLQDNPEVIHELSEISKIGATRPEGLKGGPLTKMIHLLDKSARLVRNEMFDNLVQRGKVKNTEAERREFINKIGNYNPRLMGQFQRFFKESGIAPFIVAGRTFNRLAIQRATLNPGFKTANAAAWAQSRAVEAFGVMATLVAVPTFINVLTTGKPNGRKGTLFGQIDTGKDDSKGNHIVIDPAQWIGLRRGMRVTGLNAWINGVRQGQTGKEIARNAMGDIANAVTHPWAGPSTQVGSVATTGKTTSQIISGKGQESANPNDIGENFLSALKQINPLAHAFFKDNKSTMLSGGSSVVQSLSGAAGVKPQRAISANEEIHTQARKWGTTNSDPKIKQSFDNREQEKFVKVYKPLDDALRENDRDKIVGAVRDMLSLEETPQKQAQRMKEILRRFNPVTEQGHIKPFATESKENELKFLKSLDANGKETYKSALREREANYKKLIQVIYGNRRLELEPVAAE